VRKRLALTVVVASLLAPAPPAGSRSLEQTTTSYATLGGDPQAPYSRLKLIPGWTRLVRTELAAAGKRRHLRRRSLLYFAALSDFQLADEESPARVEALDLDNSPFVSAWRPQEALEPFTVDQVVRQVNRFDRSPIRNQRRRHARLALTITTGDSADNQQINETRWVVQLLEGGRVDPNSGVDGGVCGALAGPRGEAARYTGVQTTTTCSSPAASMTPTDPRARSPPGRAIRVSWIARRFRSRPRAWTSPATSRSATTTARCRAASTRCGCSTTSRAAASSRCR